MRRGTLERFAKTLVGACLGDGGPGWMIPGPGTTVDSSTRRASAAVTIAIFCFLAAGVEDEGVGEDWRREGARRGAAFGGSMPGEVGARP